MELDRFGSNNREVQRPHRQQYNRINCWQCKINTEIIGLQIIELAVVGCNQININYQCGQCAGIGRLFRRKCCPRTLVAIELLSNARIARNKCNIPRKYVQIDKETV